MEYKTVLLLVQSLIDTIVNSAGASVAALRDFATKNIFKVTIQNPQKEVSVTGQVEILSAKGIEKQIRDTNLALRELRKPIESQKKVEVVNFPPVKFPSPPKQIPFPKMIGINNLPKELKVSNLAELVPSLKMMADSIKKMDVRPEVKVSPPVVNVDAPIVNVDAPIVNVEAPDLSEIKKIIKALDSLSAKNPVPVRLSDGAKFYKALERMADIYTGNGGGSSFQDSAGNDVRVRVNGKGQIETSTTGSHQLNDLENASSTVTYIGDERVDGEWRVRRMTKTISGLMLDYATIKQNASLINYSTAWSNRLTLVYADASTV